MALAVAGAGLWASLERPSEDGAPPASEAPAEAPARPSPMPERTEVTRAEPARAAPTSPPPVSAGAPAGCPEDEPDPPGLVRPSVWELLRVHVQELNDRLPRVAREASPALREGLRALRGDEPERAVDGLLSAPDRLQGGFDVALAGLLLAGSRALSRGELPAARRLAERAVREAPREPLAHAFAALVFEQSDDPALSRAAMARAHALLPDEPAIALASARLEADAAHFAEALRAAELYVSEHPEDARVASWRRRLELRRDLTANHARRSAGGVTLSWSRAEVSLARVDEVALTLRETLEQVARRTARPRRAELAVVIYSDAESMRRATCTPSWTGAVYDGILHLDAELVSREGLEWRRVVRHEGTHAQLAQVRGRLPTWLNEGLAQWMEGPASASARATWSRMVRDRFWIPFASLGGELLVIDDPRDAALAYHQSLAMVRYLVERRGERVLGEVADLVEDGQGEDLLDSLLGSAATGDALLTFLERSSSEVPR